MKIFGLILVLVMTFGGFMVAGGKMKVITGVILPSMPGEAMIIVGSAVGAFIVANSPLVIKHTISYFSALTKPSFYSKESYTELLSMMFMIFKMARTKGWLALESHIEEPDQSEIFSQFKEFHADHHAITFFTDYLRIISLGNDNPHEIEALMEEEIENIEHEENEPAHAVQTVADGAPALGIVAAVLGVIKTMASISEPPEVLGKLIGGALVGTFLGVWLAYGFIGPIAGAMGAKAQTKVMYYKCMKTGVVAFLGGAAPQVAIEFARKSLPEHDRPTFQELEEETNNLAMPSG